MKKLFFIISILVSVLMVGCSKDSLLTYEGCLEDTVQTDMDSLICGGSADPDYGIISDVDSINCCWGNECWAIKDGSNVPFNEALCKQIMEEGKWIGRSGYWRLTLTGKYNAAYDENRNRANYEQICLSLGVRFDDGESEALADLTPHKWPNGQIKAIPRFVYMPGIAAVDLITEQDFDATHPAGSSLADITDVFVRDYDAALDPNGGNLDWAKESRIGGKFNYVVAMPKLNISNVKILDNLHVYITRKPKSAGIYVFKQVVYMADGRQLSQRFMRYWLEEDLKIAPERPYER